MRRILAVVLLIAALVAVVVIVTAGNDDGGYKVRAIFDNAGFVIPGEDVKVAGVKVGKIDSLDVTEDKKAAVVLDITDPGYQDFRKDAECTVRPQSLIGERFVECELTQARAPGTEPPPALDRIERGPGKGQYLLPVENTSKSVDLDLVNNIMRRPVRERLSVILDELGMGVAGRGEDLNVVIRRADPALKEVDKVIRILASQNDTLKRLAVDSDTILQPLARARRHVSGAIENSSAGARATASERGALAADIERRPRGLAELTPTMQQLGALSDQMTPVVDNLGAVAPQINRMIFELGPFAKAGIPALQSLGQAAEQGTPAVTAARPVITDLRRLAEAARPVGSDARKLLESLNSTGGINRAMDYVFFQAGGINGFDSLGHYLRAALLVNQCSNYSLQSVFGCSAKFTGASATSAEAAAAASGDETLVRTARALAGKPIKPVKPAKIPRRVKTAPTPTPTPAPGATATPAATPAPSQSKTDTLLDYLFGGDG
jgi:ABC-type transporter Mla subunit MlaD